jgi:uncharacterized Zn finger protein
MKDGCPSCGDRDRQRNVGKVEREHPVKGKSAPVLYRCDACGFLYTVPPLDDDQERFAWQRQAE